MQKGIARHLSPLAAPQVLSTRVLLKVLKGVKRKGENANEYESGGTLGTINQSGHILSSRNCKQGNWVGLAWVRKARTGKNAFQICI